MSKFIFSLLFFFLSFFVFSNKGYGHGGENKGTYYERAYEGLLYEEIYNVANARIMTEDEAIIYLSHQIFSNYIMTYFEQTFETVGASLLYLVGTTIIQVRKARLLAGAAPPPAAANPNDYVVKNFVIYDTLQNIPTILKTTSEFWYRFYRYYLHDIPLTREDPVAKLEILLLMNGYKLEVSTRRAAALELMSARVSGTIESSSLKTLNTLLGSNPSARNVTHFEFPEHINFSNFSNDFLGMDQRTINELKRYSFDFYTRSKLMHKSELGHQKTSLSIAPKQTLFFLGDPGTGKTTAATKIGKFLEAGICFISARKYVDFSEVVFGKKPNTDDLGHAGEIAKCQIENPNAPYYVVVFDDFDRYFEKNGNNILDILLTILNQNTLEIENAFFGKLNVSNTLFLFIGNFDFSKLNDNLSEEKLRALAQRMKKIQFFDFDLIYKKRRFYELLANNIELFKEFNITQNDFISHQEEIDTRLTKESGMRIVEDLAREIFTRVIFEKQDSSSTNYNSTQLIEETVLKK